MLPSRLHPASVNTLALAQKPHAMTVASAYILQSRSESAFVNLDDSRDEITILSLARVEMNVRLINMLKSTSQYKLSW